MSRRRPWSDRLVLIVLGLVLIVLGLLAIDLDTTFVLPDGTVWNTSWLAQDTAAGWWPWAVAILGVGLGLLGLRWLVGHLPRVGTENLRLAGSDPQGRLEVSLSGVADALATQAESLSSVGSASGSVRTIGRVRLVEVRARVEPGPDPSAIEEFVGRSTQQVAEAFPGEAVELRVLLEGPSRARRRRRPEAAHIG